MKTTSVANVDRSDVPPMAEMLIELVDQDDEVIDGWTMEFPGVENSDLAWPILIHRDDGAFEMSGVPVEKEGMLMVTMRRQQPRGVLS